MKSLRVVIKGRVQGVWFRGWTQQQARSRRLDGWVKNRRDGSVEALFSGADADVDTMVAACREGPPPAAVASVEVFEDHSFVAPGFYVQPSD